MDPGVTAALAIGLTQYLVVLWPAGAGRERALAIGLIWILALADMAGLRLSASALNLLTAAKVLALAGVVVFAFAAGAGSWSHYVPFAARRGATPPLGEALGLGLIGAFYSFGGFWEVSRVAGEIRDPRRNLPRAMALGSAAVTALYVLTTAAFLYLVAPEQSASAPEFARRAGEALLGPSGPAAFAAVVVLSVVASAMALMLMAPRVYLAMSRDGLFPAGLAAVHPRTGAPARATALLAALASTLVLSGTFAQILAFFMCTTLAFIALAAAGLFVLRKRDGAAGDLGAPGGAAAPALFVLLLLAVMAFIVRARPLAALGGVAVVLAGLPTYRILSSRGALAPQRARGDAR